MIDNKCCNCGGSGKKIRIISGQREFGGDGSFASEYTCPDCKGKKKKVFCNACFYIGQAKSEQVCKHLNNVTKYDTSYSPENFRYESPPKILNENNDCQNFKDKDLK